MIIAEYETVRVVTVSTGGWMAPPADDVIVETLVDNTWKFYRGFDSTSNGLAYTEAKGLALALSKKITK